MSSECSERRLLNRLSCLSESDDPSTCFEKCLVFFESLLPTSSLLLILLSDFFFLSRESTRLSTRISADKCLSLSAFAVDNFEMFGFLLEIFSLLRCFS